MLLNIECSVTATLCTHCRKWIVFARYRTPNEVFTIVGVLIIDLVAKCWNVLECVSSVLSSENLFCVRTTILGTPMHVQ